uniref:non-specific protein-tyrosine kinase n=1 Tax=Strongyloides venezuelensis TaxID=75913 RepID=A0A0K0ETW3_STRVS
MVENKVAENTSKNSCCSHVSQFKNNDNSMNCDGITTSVNKDEKTILLEGGNYVGFEDKDKKKVNDDPQKLNCKNNTLNISKTTENSRNSRKSVKKRHLRSFIFKHHSTGQKTNNSRKKKIHNPIKTKVSINTYSGNELSVENKSYYHGLRPIEDFINYFTNPGDFLVHLDHVDSELKYFLVLLNNDNKIEVHTIENDGGQYYLNSVGKYHKIIPTFKAIPHLIDYYRKHHIYDRSILKCKLKRPSHYLNQSSINYDPKNGIIGQGNFACVYKGTLVEKKYKDLSIAVKVFSLSIESDTFENITERLLKILNEARILKNLNNQHIVRFYGISLDKYPVSIVMEICLGGSLENHLKTEKDKISVAERLFYCYDILDGACYLSSHNIVHRDLAARNILISNDGYLKIGDFGQALNLNTKQQSCMLRGKNKNVISLWSPPECLSNNSLAWSEKSDVWSFGVTSIEIFNDGQPPFKKENACNVVSQLKKGVYFEVPKQCHEDWHLVLKEGVFIKDQTNRFNFKQLKELLKALLTYNTSLIIPQGENIALNRRGVKRRQFKIPEKSSENSKT